MTDKWSRRFLGGGLIVLTTWFVMLWFSAGPRGHLYTGDSNILVAGAQTIVDCFGDGTFRRCGVGSGVVEATAVGAFPPLQYLPAVAMIGPLGLAADVTLEFLGRLSTLCLIFIVGAGAFAARRYRSVWPLLIVALAFGAGSYQATSAFGEMLAAAALVAAAVCALGQRPLLTGGLAALACLGKETLPPFVVVLLLVAGWGEGERFPPRRLNVAIVSGCVLGAAINAAFNLFRFGSFLNVNYLQEEFRTPGLARQVRLAAAVWLSPSAGVLWFWPFATVGVLGGAVIAVRSWLAGDRRIASLAGFAGPAIVVVGFLGLLARWYAPFGWVVYGPRLAAPILPAATIVVAVRAGDVWSRAVGQGRGDACTRRGARRRAHPRGASPDHGAVGLSSRDPRTDGRRRCVPTDDRSIPRREPTTVL